MNPRGRMREIPKSTPIGSRHEHRPKRREADLRHWNFFGGAVVKRTFSSHHDARNFIRGDGGNLKLRVEMRTVSGNKTVAISASQWRIESSGVAGDALPLAEGLLTAIHGATLAAARPIARERWDIARWSEPCAFLRNRHGGRPCKSKTRVRLAPKVMAALSAEKCGLFGAVFRRSPDGLVHTPGIDGVAPPECIPRAHRLPV